MNIRITLNSGEQAFLDSLVEGTEIHPPTIFRALLKLAADKPSLARAAVNAAQEQAIVAPTATTAPRRISVDEYRAAIESTGSIDGAARQLDVHRTSVLYMARKHNLS